MLVGVGVCVCGGGGGGPCADIWVLMNLYFKDLEFPHIWGVVL